MERIYAVRSFDTSESTVRGPGGRGKASVESPLKISVADATATPASIFATAELQQHSPETEHAPETSVSKPADLKAIKPLLIDAGPPSSHHHSNARNLALRRPNRHAFRTLHLWYILANGSPFHCCLKRRQYANYEVQI